MPYLLTSEEHKRRLPLCVTLLHLIGCIKTAPAGTTRDEASTAARYLWTSIKDINAATSEAQVSKALSDGEKEEKEANFFIDELSKKSSTGASSLSSHLSMSSTATQTPTRLAIMDRRPAPFAPPQFSASVQAFSPADMHAAGLALAAHSSPVEIHIPHPMSARRAQILGVDPVQQQQVQAAMWTKESRVAFSKLQVSHFEGTARGNFGEW